MVMDKLHGIAEKELSGEDFTEEEGRFLGSVLYTIGPAPFATTGVSVRPTRRLRLRRRSLNPPSRMRGS